MQNIFFFCLVCLGFSVFARAPSSGGSLGIFFGSFYPRDCTSTSHEQRAPGRGAHAAPKFARARAHTRTKHQERPTQRKDRQTQTRGTTLPSSSLFSSEALEALVVRNDGDACALPRVDAAGFGPLRCRGQPCCRVLHYLRPDGLYRCRFPVHVARSSARRR